MRWLHCELEAFRTLRNFDPADIPVWFRGPREMLVLVKGRDCSNTTWTRVVEGVKKWRRSPPYDAPSSDTGWLKGVLSRRLDVTAALVDFKPPDAWGQKHLAEEAAEAFRLTGHLYHLGRPDARHLRFYEVGPQGDPVGRGLDMLTACLTSGVTVCSGQLMTNHGGRHFPEVARLLELRRFPVGEGP